MDSLFNFTKESDEEHWISVSDLMAGLMIIFLFIAISLMIEPKGIEDRINASLQKEFQNELKDGSTTKWRAELKGLTFRFKDIKELEGRVPVVLFQDRSDVIEPNFEDILDDFIPRYLKVLNQYREDIAEVRIEGHTSSGYLNLSSDDAYFENMALSQKRTRAVLKFTLERITEDEKEWLKPLLTANGLSSSELIKDEGVEDTEASRRVEFEVRTNFSKKLFELLGDRK